MTASPSEPASSMGRAINMLISVSQSRESRREAAPRRACAVGLPLTDDMVR